MILKKILTIDFCGFWNGFNKLDNFFVNLLKHDYELKISNNPQILFYSVFSNEHTKYNCFKIFYTGENIIPNLQECDFAFSFEPNSEKNFRLPIFRLIESLEDLTRQKKIEDFLPIKNKFCCTVVSNPKGQQRNEFFNQLSKYKTVDSGGKYMNNIGGPVEDKISFLREYKFTLAFENAFHRGYTTEKLVEPMISGSIPIYWGNPDIADEFNAKSFINVNDYDNWEKAIEKIVELDNDDSKYLEMLVQPPFPDNSMPDHLNKEIIRQRLKDVVELFFSDHPITGNRKDDNPKLKKSVSLLNQLKSYLTPAGRKF